MPCVAFENRLLDYTDLSAAAREIVDAHTSTCADCREYLETLTSIDVELTLLLAEARPSRNLAAGIVERRPTALPELLDFVGWSAVASILSMLAWWWLAPVTLSPTVVQYAPYAAALVAMAAGLWIGFRSWVELRD